MKRTTCIWAWLVILVIGGAASAGVDVVWNVPSNITTADWNTAGNWSPARVPGSNNNPSDNATLNNNGTANYSTNVTDSFQDIRFGDGAAGGGTINQSAGTINAAGWLRMNISGTANSTYTLSGTAIMNVARVNVNEGGTTGSSTLNVQGGTLAIPTSNTGGGQGALFINGGVTMTPGVGTVNVSSGTLSVGGDTAANQSILIGSNGGISIAQFNVSGFGNVTVGTGNFEVGSQTSGAVNQTGGNVSLFTSANSSSWVHVGDFGNGTYTLSGGTLTLTNAHNDLVLGNVGSGEFDLNGGTATLGAIFGFGSSRVFNFNGGTLRPNADQTAMDQAAFVDGLTTANVRNGGAIIDTNGHNVTIAQPLVHSTIFGDNAIDGGLSKKGSGTLTLAGGSNYTGPTKVSGGTLLVFGDNNGYATNGAAYTIAGAGSTLGTTNSGSPFFITNGSTMTVTSGGHFAPSSGLGIGSIFSFSGGGTLIVDGAGSSATTPQNTGFALGFGGLPPLSGVLTVSNNATFTVGTGGTSNIVNGTININGGSIDLKTLNYTSGSSVTVNFNSGSLSFLGDLHVGVGGFLGQGLFLDSSKVLSLSGTTTIDQFKTLSLAGGTFNTGTIVNNGTFDYTAGTLNITGASGLIIGNGGALGSSVIVPVGANLNVANATQILSGASLTVNGGSFSTLTLDNSVSVTTNGTFVGSQQIVNHAGGTIDITGGVFSTPFMQNIGSLIQDGGVMSIGAFGLLNTSGSYFYIGQNRTATVNGSSLNAGEIQLGGASALLTGSGTLDNTGLVHGDGVIGNPVINDTGGEIRAEAGKRIKLTGANGANGGRINLQGGTAEFSQALTNTGNGLIDGRGTLITGGTGLLNQANVSFSSGITDVFGKVSNSTASATKGISVSGNADVTFWDDVSNGAGSLFKVSGGSSATFFGTYGGAGITGGGEVNMEADVTPGFSPAAVTFGGNLLFDSTSTLHLDLGGTTPGNGPNNHDQVNVVGTATLGGGLDLVPYNGFVPVSGDKFVVMTYASASGTFATVTGTNPAPGLTYTPVHQPTSLVILTTTNGEKTWGVDASGNSSVGANWIGGVAPGGVGDTATFSTIITAPRTVTLDVDTIVGTIKFDSPFSYLITGTHTLNLQASGTTPAAINVSSVHGNGAHAISATVTLASDLSIVQNSSGTLRLSGPLNDSRAHTITKSGSGAVEIAGSPNLGANTVLMASTGTLRFALTSGSATVGTGVQAVVTGSATLELAGAASALSSGPNRANILNSSTAPAGLLVSGTHQQVGFIDGSGTTQVNAGSDLTANHIIQSALVIGGTSVNPGLVTIAASDAAGGPLGQTFSEPSAAELAAWLQAASAIDVPTASFSDLPPSALTVGDASVASSSVAVPEPTAIMLIWAGLGGLVIRARHTLAFHDSTAEPHVRFVLSLLYDRFIRITGIRSFIRSQPRSFRLSESVQFLHQTDFGVKVTRA